MLLLDKTGTITLGNRQALEFLPVGGVDVVRLADAAQLASLADETPEGRSIVVLAKTKYGLRGRDMNDSHATLFRSTKHRAKEPLVFRHDACIIEQHITRGGDTLLDGVAIVAVGAKPHGR